MYCPFTEKIASTFNVDTVSEIRFPATITPLDVVSVRQETSLSAWCWVWLLSWPKANKFVHARMVRFLSDGLPVNWEQPCSLYTKHGNHHFPESARLRSVWIIYWSPHSAKYWLTDWSWIVFTSVLIRKSRIPPRSWWKISINDVGDSAILVLLSQRSLRIIEKVRCYEILAWLIVMASGIYVMTPKRRIARNTKYETNCISGRTFQ